MKAFPHAEFEPTAQYVVVKDLSLNGRKLRPGDPFDKTLVSPRRLRQLYEASRHIGIDVAVPPSPPIIEAVPVAPAPTKRRRRESA